MGYVFKVAVLESSNSHYGIASKSNDCKFDLFLVLCIVIIFDHFLVKSAMIAVKNNKIKNFYFLIY